MTQNDLASKAMNKTIDGLSLNCGSKVTFFEGQLKGVIRSILANEMGIQYQVSFWCNETRKLEWVFRDEFYEGWDV